jgi:hypothetical protein
MSKSNLRKEYEARMGVVEDTLQLFNAEGKLVYFEDSSGYWEIWQYNEVGKQVYSEDSDGMVRDNRPNKAKIFTDEKGTKYKVEVIK